MATVGKVNEYHSHELFREPALKEGVDSARRHASQQALSPVKQESDAPLTIEQGRRSLGDGAPDSTAHDDSPVKLEQCRTQRSDSGFFDGSRGASNDALGPADLRGKQGLSGSSAVAATAIKPVPTRPVPEVAEADVEDSELLPAPTVMPESLEESIAQLKDAQAQVKAVAIVLGHGAKFDNLEYIDKAKIDALESACSDWGITFLYWIRGESKTLRKAIAQYADVGKAFAAEAKRYADAVKQSGNDIEQVNALTEAFNIKINRYADRLDKIRENLPQAISTGWWPPIVSLVCTVATFFAALPFIAEAATAATLVGLVAGAAAVIAAAGMALWDFLEKLISVYNEKAVVADGSVDQSTENLRKFWGKVVSTVVSQNQHHELIQNQKELLHKHDEVIHNHHELIQKQNENRLEIIENTNAVKKGVTCPVF